MTEPNPLVYRDFKYGTEESRKAGEAEFERVQRLLEEGLKRRAQSFEERLRSRYLASGGDEDSWQREKSGIISEARRQQTVHGDDVARRLSASRYGG
jgi:hypothetical protein